MPQATFVIDQVYAPNKGGWFNVVADDGTRFSTKKSDVAEAAKAAKNREATLTYTESQNGEYTNRYLDKVELVGGGSNGSAPAASSDEKEQRIMRQAAAKVAVQVLPHLPEGERTPNAVVAIAEFFLDYFSGGADTASTASTSTADDDIPF